ncbi:MAG: hypothetical protein AVDCRST_MAG66-1083 [uncultured Pseudonocardia sp.]|uniref:Uncharacterized protein n=1 Tax=uncultured Pseudonocardia sp. TaxID=211455 RepID=A0A6J4NTY0_9PSEU|nr:MAG: hypothetical protein AVDCRST_MAG66-1083 [uncultured Pseudonocardia sp.]
MRCCRPPAVPSAAFSAPNRSIAVEGVHRPPHGGPARRMRRHRPRLTGPRLGHPPRPSAAARRPGRAAPRAAAPSTAATDDSRRALPVPRSTSSLPSPDLR